jgi:hypothetical protein
MLYYYECLCHCYVDNIFFSLQPSSLAPTASRQRSEARRPAQVAVHGQEGPRLGDARRPAPAAGPHSSGTHTPHGVAERRLQGRCHGSSALERRRGRPHRGRPQWRSIGVGRVAGWGTGAGHRRRWQRAARRGTGAGHRRRCRGGNGLRRGVALAPRHGRERKEDRVCDVRQTVLIKIGCFTCMMVDRDSVF